jgi:hypothetical protein
MISSMKNTVAAMASMLVLAGACREPLSAPNEDAPVAGGPQTVQSLTTGVLAQDRAATSAFSYLLYPEGLARNSLRPDPNEPRFVSELIGVPSDPSAFIGGSGFNGYFTGIRTDNQFIKDKSVLALPGGDRNAAIGLVQSIKAIQYLRVLQLRDSLGSPIQTDQVLTADPFRTKTAVLTYVSSVLDSAYGNLTAAGVSAKNPVTLPSGYTANGDFSTTANVAKFNRGLKGEVEVYRLLDHQSPCATCAASAIAALNVALAGQSAAPTVTELAFGPYFEYNPSAPESFVTPLADPKIYLTDNFVSSLQSGDARSSKATKTTSVSVTNGGLSTALSYRSFLTLSTNQTRQVPLRRAGFWYLLRAQAEAESGQLAAATADVNVVHQAEGGLPALAAFASVAEARAAILYEYRYSFVFEGPYYLVALRQYSALTQAYASQAGMPTLKSDPTHTTDPLQSVLPIPSNEVVARGGGAITPLP